MQEKFSNSFSVGILDKDKKVIIYLKEEFTLLNSKIHDFALLYKHKIKHHYIIQLCPESETWICNVANHLKINLEVDFELPSQPKILSKYTKSIISKFDPNLIRLFKLIERRAKEVNFEPVLELKRWLVLLVEHNYQIDENELRNG